MSDGPLVTALQVQANRFQLVSRIADDLAHEIKNPLHGMIINLELMKRRALAGRSEEVVQRAELVSGEVMRVNTLIDQLLTLVRPGRSADRQPVDDVDRLVEELLPVLQAQARLSSVELVYEGVGATVGAPIRRDALRLVLLNLFAAALERVRASGGRVRVSARRAEGVLRIAVSDSEAGSTRGASGRPSSLEALRAMGDSGRDRTGAAETDSPGAPDDGDIALGLAVARHLVEAAGGALEEGSGQAGERVAGVSFPAPGSLDPGSRAPVL